MNEKTSTSQRMAAFDDSDSVNDAIDLLFIEHYVSGSHPFARSSFLPRVRKDATLLPPGSEPIRIALNDGVRSVMASGPGWLVCAVRWPHGHARVSVLAQTEELAQEIFAQATDGAVLPPALDRSKVDIGFWHTSGHGPMRSVRTLTVPGWQGMRTSYGASAASAFDGLMSMTREGLPGKLLLLHGPPGTGKTTALRSLSDAWREWCQFDYVLDPERLFDDAAYLLNIALGDDEQERTRRSRLLILEDCDELIASSAKQRSGQGLARLLNLTDGLLGQGLSLLVAITTNEALSSLHPAVVRAGRCIAQIEVGNLSSAEAQAWLGRSLPERAEGYPLAELFALRDGTEPVRATASPAPVGQYL
ncbi:MAG TPA: DUF5925 domain-containing protein [Acidimicrobiales bacterium]|nr:DUF5925 domain-containing protein [Acidimicrobiales bacterium]